MVGRTLGIGETGLQQRLHIPGIQLRLRERIRNMMHLAAADATRALREEQVALGEEKFERAGFGRVCFVGQLIAKTRWR
jgi:hypothetical protein